MMAMMAAATVVQVEHNTIHPQHASLIVWNAALWVVILYNLIMIAYRTAFDASSGVHAGLVIDYLGDLVFIIDIVLRCRKIGIVDDGTLYLDPKDILRIYSRTFLIPNIIISLPLDVFVLAFSKQNLLHLSLLRILKIFRFVTTPFPSLGSRISRRSSQYLKLVYLFFAIVLAAHVVGSIFFIIATQEVLRHNTTAGNTSNITNNASLVVNSSSSSTNMSAMTTGSWGSLVQYIDDAQPSVIHVDIMKEGVPSDIRIVRSIYWAITLLTNVGYGDIYPQSDFGVFYTTIIMLLGGMLYAAILVALEEIIAQADISSIIFFRKREEFLDYIEYRNLTPDIKARIENYLNMLWMRNRGIDEQRIFEFLSVPLMTSIIEFEVGNFGSKIPIIEDYECTAAMARYMQPQSVSAGEVVFMKGSIPLGLYCIGRRGKVNYMMEDGQQVIKTFLPRDVFGECAFLLKELQPCHAWTREITDLYILTRTNFESFLSDNKDIAKRLEIDIVEKEDYVRKKANLESLGKNLNRKKLKTMFGGSNQKPIIKRDYVFMPDSPFRQFWCCVLALCILIIMVTLPPRIGFNEDSYPAMPLLSPMLWLDIIIDIIHIVDTFLNCRYFAVESDDAVIDMHADIWSHYSRSIHFYTDLIVCIPLDHIILAAGERSVLRISMWRLTKYLRLLHISSLYNTLQGMFAMYVLALRSSYRQLSMMLTGMLLLIHTFACARAAIDKSQGLYYNNSVADITPMTRYQFWAFYTVTTIGYGTVPGLNIVTYTNLQAMFTMLVMISGAFLSHAGITAVLTNLIKNIDEKAIDDRILREKFDRYMVTRNLSDSHRDRIRQYLEFKRSKQGNLNEVRILDSLADGLKIDVLRHVAMEIQPNLENVELFKSMTTPGMVESMILLLKKETVVSNTWILHEDRLPEKFWFIVRGQVAIQYHSQKFIVAEGVIGSMKERHGACTLNTCEFFTLSISDYYMLHSHTMKIGGIFADLKGLLSDSIGYEYLHRFAKSQYNEENVEFYSRIEQFKQIHQKNYNEIAKESSAIYEEFISNDASKCVNIDFKTRSDIDSRMIDPDITIFTAAQNVIYDNIRRDTLPRFTASTMFKAMIEAKASQQMNAAKKKGSGGRSTNVKRKDSSVGRRRRMSIGELNVDPAATAALGLSGPRRNSDVGLELLVDIKRKMSNFATNIKLGRSSRTVPKELGQGPPAIVSKPSTINEE